MTTGGKTPSLSDEVPKICPTCKGARFVTVVGGSQHEITPCQTCNGGGLR